MAKCAARCLALVLVLSSLLLAADPFLGGWKANLEKSQLDPSHPAKEAHMRFDADRAGYRVTISGINGSGKTVSQTLVFQTDGKEHTTADPNATMRVSKPNARTIETVGSSGGREVGWGTYVVSDDGRTMTATVSGDDANHRTFKTVMVFERE